MAIPQDFHFIVDWLSTIMPGNAFTSMTNLFAVEPANNGALVALIVSVVWTIGFPILSFILFKTRATLDR